MRLLLACYQCPIPSSRSSPRLASRWTGRTVAFPVPACFPTLMLSVFAARRFCLLGVASCVVMKKAGGVFVFPVRLLLCLYDVVFALVVVVHEALLIDDVAIRSAQADVRVCVAWLELLAHAEAVRPAFHI